MLQFLHVPPVTGIDAQSYVHVLPNCGAADVHVFAIDDAHATAFPALQVIGCGGVPALRRRRDIVVV